MRTTHKHARAFANVLLSAIVSPVFLISSCTNGQTAPKPSGKATPTAAKRPSALRLKLHAFPDVTMGAPMAYTVMLPPKWSAKGKVEWQPVGEALFPQQIFEITSPQKGRISYEPPVTFSYMEASGMGSQGVPAPANFPEWLVQTVAKTNPKVRNVRLVSSRRDTKAEAFLKKIERDTGGSGGMEREVWTIVMDYNEGGIRRREEASVTYVRFAPYNSPNMNSQLWSISHSGSYSAPANQFATQRGLLVNVASTLRPTPQWFIQSQSVIAEMSRQRTAKNWEIIRQRGQKIDQLSDADYAKYKKSMSGSDNAHRQRINTINETDDFRDSNGDIVNLPMHYQHVFSDGKGNYVLSNSSQDKPGALWKPIRPMK
ncbi:MAG TPA: hypothetical protein VF681_01470 [Abditibacteriaceae bacterium]|jgi:hypothetical protein